MRVRLAVFGGEESRGGPGYGSCLSVLLVHEVVDISGVLGGDDGLDAFYDCVVVISLWTLQREAKSGKCRLGVHAPMAVIEASIGCLVDVRRESTVLVAPSAMEVLVWEDLVCFRGAPGKRFDFAGFFIDDAGYHWTHHVQRSVVGVDFDVYG